MANTESKEERITRLQQELFEMTATTEITVEQRDDYLTKVSLLNSLISE